MEKEYQKIGNVFKFDEKFRTIVGLNEPYETLKNIIWQGTEKIDGTSTTILVERLSFGRFKTYICSRNICFGDGKSALKGIRHPGGGADNFCIGR